MSLVAGAVLSHKYQPILDIENDRLWFAQRLRQIE
jgi:hypothetical protein